MRRNLFALMLAACVLAAPAAAQNTRQLDPGAASPPATLDIVAWLEGRWVGEGLGGVVEEAYSPPRNGVMLGHFAAWTDTGARFYEIITFREEGGSVMLRLRHFHPDLKGWEEKDETVEFPLVAVEGDRLYFAGLTIERVGEDQARHYVLVGHRDGTAQEAEFTYRRAD